MPTRSARWLMIAGWLLAPAAEGAAPADPAQYLPAAAAFDAEYVVVEPDPAFAGYGQKIRAAMTAKRAWLEAYRRENAGKDPLPYHPNFGVTKRDYEHFSRPMNQFHEVSRRRIRVGQTVNGARVALTFAGSGLLFDRLEIDTATPAVTTPRDTIVFRDAVALEVATLPPAAHEGVLFNSSDAAVMRTRARESVLVGRLRGTQTGIIHYELYSDGKPRRAYVTYALKR